MVLPSNSEFGAEQQLEGVDVARNDTRHRGTRPAPRRLRIPPPRLDGMIEEAIVDAYTEAEQAVGFHATIEQHLAVPFETVVLGAPVTVKKVDVTLRGELVAVCYRGRERQAIPILEQRLEIPNQTDAVQEELDLARQQAGEG